jgi:hypothetical protein
MTNIYRTALQVQDASNPSGVILSLSREILPGIQAEPEYREQGTRYIYNHPAFILFIDKLASLSGHWLSGDDMLDYYRVCEERAAAIEAQS